jgi:predicted phage-related endonuclease
MCHSTVEDLSQNEQANQLFAQLIQEKHHIEKHQNSFDETKHQIQMLMKDAERATFANGSVTWKRSKDSIALDSKAVLKLHPEMLEQFPQNKAGTRRFQIYSDD